MGIVAGWGRLSEGGQLPNILQYVSNKKLGWSWSWEGISKMRPHPSSKFGIKKEGRAQRLTNRKIGEAKKSD